LPLRPVCVQAVPLAGNCCFRIKNAGSPTKRVRSGESRKRSEILAIGDPQGVATFAGLVLVKTAFFRNAERSDSA